MELKLAVVHVWIERSRMNLGGKLPFHFDAAEKRCSLYARLEQLWPWTCFILFHPMNLPVCT